jgi:hypothetical protein
MVPPESAQTSAAKYTALAGEASAEAAMKRVTAAEVGASRDRGKGATEMSAAEAASEMTAAEATTKMAAAGMAATEAAPKMAAPAETTMAAATAATRQCGGRKRGATDGNGHCKNKDGFTRHDKLLLRIRPFFSLHRLYACDVRVSRSSNRCLPPLAPTWRGLRSSPTFTAL